MQINFLIDTCVFVEKVQWIDVFFTGQYTQNVSTDRKVVSI